MPPSAPVRICWEASLTVQVTVNKAEFAAALAGHSDLGSALTMRGVQAARPSLYALTDELAEVRIPVLVLVAVDRFLGAVARGAWHPRDPRSVSDSTMGLR